MSESNFFEVVVYSAVGVRTVNAIGISRVKETYERKDENRWQMERALDGKVEFHCDDFDYFFTLSKSERRYDEVRAEISIYCGNVWTLKWRTFIEILKGTFDEERKVFTVSFTLEGTSRDFDSRKSTEFNLLEIVSTRVTTTQSYAANLVYTNGVPVYNALLAMLREILAVTSVKSDFFQWNSTAPLYTYGNSAKLRNMALFHKSDIVKASLSGYQAATILDMSPERLINDLCNLCNLQYTLDTAGNFRIEHASWFAHGAGLDLTLPKYTNSLKGTKEISFDEPKLFRLEKFEAEGAVNTDFVGVPIEYDNAFIRAIRPATGSFTTEQPNEDVLTREVSVITDIDAIYGNVNGGASSVPNRDQDLDGVVLLALDANNSLQKIGAILGHPASQQFNNVLAWAQLQNDYWKYGRLFPTGAMNLTATNFVSLQRIKKRKRLTIPFCCDESLDADGIFTTDLGDAVAKRIAIDVYRSTLEVDLLYKDETVVVLGAPNAVDDIYATDISTTLNTLTASKPSVLANDVGATSVIPKTGLATMSGGSVDLASNGHFIYTPPLGISGTDAFNYVALNGVGQADSATVKIIIKVSAIYVHIIFKQSTLIFYPPVGSPPVGLYRKYSEIHFYEDPLLQVPLDLTYYGLVIGYSQTINGVTTTGSFVAKGTFQILNGASGSTAYPTYTAAILTSPNYTII